MKKKKYFNDQKTLQDFLENNNYKHIKTTPKVINKQQQDPPRHHLQQHHEGEEQEQEPLSVFIETYGCQMNVSDSEIVRSVLLEAGHVMSDSLESADVIVANTCAIRGEVLLMF